MRTLFYSLLCFLSSGVIWLNIINDKYHFIPIVSNKEVCLKILVAFFFFCFSIYNLIKGKS